MDATKVIPKSLLNTRQKVDFFPVYGKKSAGNHKSQDRNTGTDAEYSTSTPSDKKNPPENQLELPSIEKLCITQNDDLSLNRKTKDSTVGPPNGSAEVAKNDEKPKNSKNLTVKVIPKSLLNTRQKVDFFPVYGKKSAGNHKSEDRNTGTDAEYSTSMPSDKKNPPENQLELPGIEKLCITQSDDLSLNPKTENSTVGTPNSSVEVVKTNEKPKNSKNLTFKATPANSSDLKGFDKIFERRIKPEGIIEELDRGELLICKNSQSKNSQFENSLEICCRIDKDIVKRLIERHSIKDYPGEDFVDRFFKIEAAFYDYLELHVFRSNRLDKCTLLTFAWHVHNLEPSLRIYLHNLSTSYTNWKEYKYSAPTYGAAIFSEDASHVVMVQSSICNNSWGFPKGKIKRNEDPISCTIREVREEIGFDIQHLIRDDNYIEHHDYNGKTYGLYIIEGIPRDTKFTTKCKYEIKAIEWKPIEDLVTYRGNFLINKVCRYFIPKLKDKKIIQRKVQ